MPLQHVRNAANGNSGQQASPVFFLLCWVVADSMMTSSPSQHYKDSLSLKPGKADPGLKRNSFLKHAAFHFLKLLLDITKISSVFVGKRLV